MTCPHCTAFNAADARFCQQCSQPLHDEPSLLAGEEVRERNRVSDTGYLLIALSALALNLLNWIYSRWLATQPIQNRIGTGNSFTTAAYLYPLLLFAILFAYSRRTLYRVLIAASALIILYINIRRILHY